jgi:hypothetical protein
LVVGGPLKSLWSSSRKQAIDVRGDQEGGH